MSHIFRIGEEAGKGSHVAEYKNCDNRGSWRRSGNGSENLCLLSVAGSSAAVAPAPKQNRLNQYVCMYSWRKCWGFKALLREHRSAKGATARLLQGVPLLIYDLSRVVQAQPTAFPERYGDEPEPRRSRNLPSGARLTEAVAGPAGSEEVLTAIAISRLCTNKLMHDNGLLIEGSGATWQ